MYRLLHSSVRFTVVLTLAAFAALAVACSSDPDSNEAGDEASVPAAASAPTAPCAEVSEAMTEAFAGFTLIEDEGRYVIGDAEGSGCRTLVVGSAAELPHFVEIAQMLGGLLSDAGWVEDTARAADGPTGTIAVYERDGELAVVAAGASPEDPAACGADELISDCFERLDPSEIEMQGSITVSDAVEVGG